MVGQVSGRAPGLHARLAGPEVRRRRRRLPHQGVGMSGRPAVFLDRDGTLMEEVGYCSSPGDVAVYAGVRESLARLRDAGFALIVITNQSGIGLGYFTETTYRAVHDEFVRQLAPVHIDGTYFSPDAPDSGSPRRKPAPGMVYEAAEEHGVDLSRS